MARRERVGASLAIVAALSLSACAAEPRNTPPPAESTAPSSTMFVPDLDQFTPPPAGVIDDKTGQTTGPKAPAVWDDTSRAAAVAAAETAMTAYARPTVDANTWIEELTPLLTPKAAKDYNYLRNSTIPATQVTGPGVIVNDDSVYLAHVEVPTDAGTWTVMIVREYGDSPWLVERFAPPAGMH
ncbi:hypothetical protein [Pseudoclavibacter terrae]|uniref:Lipoprotein n=1 Tax=Pseudoclavibacter terrae TaxID=1530195 RepID=A0A7J5AXF6_9MICO|nr:hypothetical protein [Pseudoclavibacter terrae]KAB1636065.1 hypothetical protein F8O03_17555 [Pseudoclavibacter terrae]